MIRFKIGLTWEVSEGVERLLIVTGKRQAPIPARLTGHPDTWAPAAGGEIEDLAVTDAGGARLPYHDERALLDDDRFLRAVDEKVEEAYGSKRNSR